jgi:hypothetical protein
MEGLGRATYHYTESFENTVGRAAHRAEQGRAHIVVTPARNPALKNAVNRLRDLTGGLAHVIFAEDFAREEGQ